MSADGFEAVDLLKVDPASATLFEAGWQSWSPCGTYSVTGPSPRPETDWQQAMRFRPGRPARDEGFQSEGILVVATGSSDEVVTYSSVSHLRVPSIRAAMDGRRLRVSADGPVSISHRQGTIVDALAAWAEEVAHRAGVRTPLTPAPTVWCSWYEYFLGVTAKDIRENLVAIDRHDLPIDVVQIDDGWQAGIGDWSAYSEPFADLPALVDEIRASGRRAGIWIAPLTVGSSSRLAAEHPDWLVPGGGGNWGQDLFGVDVTEPGAEAYLRDALGQIRDLGVDYVKLDFMYTGALPGRRHLDVTPVEAYRTGLEVIRDVFGPETFLLGCGAPLVPSVGLVDGMRVSGDVFNPVDDELGTERLRGEAAIKARAWQHGRLWVNDADCLVARPDFPLRERWAALIEDHGGLRSCSDRVQALDQRGLELTRRLLSTVPAPTPFVPRT